MCQILSRSVQGLRGSDTPKIAISHWLAASPLQQCGTTVRHCDLFFFSDQRREEAPGWILTRNGKDVHFGVIK